MKRSRLLGLACGMVFAGAPACGDGEWSGTEARLENGAVVVRNPAEGTWEEGDAWHLSEEVRIGRVEGEGPDVFGRIDHLAVDSEGRVWVFDGQAVEVRVFGNDGVHVATIGRGGGGPGEFRRVTGLLSDPRGGVWVVDSGNRRYTRYAADGTELETRPRESALPISSAWVAMLEDGRLYDIDAAPPDPDGPAAPAPPPMLAAAGIGVLSGMVMRAMFDAGGDQALDTVRLPEQERSLPPFNAGGAFLGVPWAPLLHSTIDRRGYIWFGESDAYRIYQRRFAGDTVRVVEREYTRLPVRASEVEAWLEEPGPTRIRERGGEIDRSRIPSEKPVFEQLLVGESGELWVRLVTANDDVTFDVFAEQGRYLGEVAAPPGVRLRPSPVIRGERFHAVVADSLDVSYIAILSYRR